MSVVDSFKKYNKEFKSLCPLEQRHAIANMHDELKGAALKGEITGEGWDKKDWLEVNKMLVDYDEYYKEKMDGKLPLVSIVVPVCNVEKYIRPCMDSILAQSLKEIEVIVVDDGSTDKSGEILDEYVAMDERVHVIHKVNEGYGKAMNVGMDAATAPYIGIVESDDFIEPDTYERLLGIIKDQNCDIVKTDFFMFYDKDGERIEDYVDMIHDPNLQWFYGTKHKASVDECVLTFDKFTWAGIYKTSLIRDNNIRHNETPGASYQDNGFWFQTFVHADNIYFDRHAYYHYRIDNAGASFYSDAKIQAYRNEFNFVDSKLDEMGDAGKQFYKWSAYFRLRDCVWNIERIADENKHVMTDIIREDFIRLSAEGRIDERVIHPELKQQIFSIMCDPESFNAGITAARAQINNVVGPYDTIILYGAGIIGNRALERLRVGRNNVKIKCFAVTDKNGNPEKFAGIPIRNINELLDERDHALVIISVGRAHQQEVRDSLTQKGFKNMISYYEMVGE